MPDVTAPSPSRTLAYLPLAGIDRAERNPKEHDLPAIRASIAEFGCTIGGIIDERTGRLIAGHGRLAVLDQMREAGNAPPEGVTLADDGDWLIPILRGWSSRSDTGADAYLVADNRTGEKGGWDDHLLAEVLSDIDRKSVV